MYVNAFAKFKYCTNVKDYSQIVLLLPELYKNMASANDEKSL